MMAMRFCGTSLLAVGLRSCCFSSSWESSSTGSTTTISGRVGWRGTASNDIHGKRGMTSTSTQLLTSTPSMRLVTRDGESHRDQLSTSSLGLNQSRRKELEATWRLENLGSKAYTYTPTYHTRRYISGYCCEESCYQIFLCVHS